MERESAGSGNDEFYGKSGENLVLTLKTLPPTIQI